MRRVEPDVDCIRILYRDITQARNYGMDMDRDEWIRLAGWLLARLPEAREAPSVGSDSLVSDGENMNERSKLPR